MQVNGNEGPETHSSMRTTANVPSYVIDAMSSGVNSADFDETVKQARRRWIAVLAWRGMLPADTVGPG